MAYPKYEAPYSSAQRPGESQQAFEAVIEASPLAMVATAPDGSVTLWNAAAEHTFGWSRQEVLTHPLPFIPEDKDEKLSATFTRSLQGRIISAFETQAKRKDGSLIDISISTAPVRDAEGRITGVMAVISDITRLVGNAQGKLAAIVESSDDAIISKTLDGIIQTWNHAAERIFGYSADEVVGHPISILIPPDRVHEETEILDRLKRGKRIEHFETERVAKDGRHVQISLAISPILDADGRVIGASKVARDITERKQMESKLRENDERLRAIFNQTSVGIAQVDLSGRFVLVNQEFCRMAGRSAQELLELRMQDITHPDDVAYNQVLFDWLVKEGGNFEIEKRYVLPDGSLIWVHNSVAAITDPRGKPEYVVAISQDISDRRCAEMALQEIKADLEQRVQQRTRELQAANETLQQHTEALIKSNVELERFAYVCSHDLREPLRMVSSFSDLLARRHKDKLEPEAREFLDFIMDGASRMDQLIRDVLSYSRLSSREKKAERVDCESVLLKASINLSSAIADSQAKVTHDPLPVVEGDTTQLTQLFQNLLGNALKFRRGAPRIHISATRDGQHCRFSVKDNGIGIESQYRDRIFQIFQRLHTRSEYTGTGIGLAICKKIVENHGGRIWVESAPGKGSTFYFTLPIAGHTEPAPRPS